MGQKKNIIIAEIGSTHDGSLSLAKKSIREAANSGADAVKFQLHVAEDETLTNAPHLIILKMKVVMIILKEHLLTLKNGNKLLMSARKIK